MITNIDDLVKSQNPMAK